MLRAALVAVVAVSALAFARGALAYPTSPVLQPIPSTVTAVTPTYPIAWAPATFDLTETYPFVKPLNYYLIDIDFYRAPAPDPVWHLQRSQSGTTFAAPLLPGYRYVVKVRAVQEGWCDWLGTWFQCVSPQYGGAAGDVFDVVPMPSIDVGH